MKKVKTLFLGLLAVLLIVLGVFYAVGVFRPKGAGLRIETTPVATVFINGEEVGKTPFESTRDPGEIVLKLIPESFDGPLSTFETKLELVSGIQTVVRREFGETEEASGGDIISFDKTNSKEAELAVVTIPDASQVTIDGSIRGFAPYKTKSLSSGEHQIIIKAPGFSERTLTLRARTGYKLTLIVKLVPNPGETDNLDKEVEKEVVQKVRILKTPTGFLRVRSGPSTADAEISQVTPDKEYVFLEKDEEENWLKIVYEEDKEGWVSAEYAEIIKDEASPSPSPTP